MFFRIFLYFFHIFTIFLQFIKNVAINNTQRIREITKSRKHEQKHEETSRASIIQHENNKHVGYPISKTEDRIVARKSGIDQEPY